MGSDWSQSTWGEEISLEYGKGLRGYKDAEGPYRVYGSNGPVGWTSSPLAPGPGVILGRKGAYRGLEYSEDPFFVIDTAYYVKIKTDLHMRWLYYAIKHYKLGEIDDGSPIPSTTRAAVYIRKLQVPPSEEQRAIAHILGSLDDKIELNRQMNSTLEKMAQAIFKSWFIDFDPVRTKAEGHAPDLPNEIADFFPDSFEDSELGPIPKGWKVGCVADLGELICGKTPPTKDLENYGKDVPFVTIPDMHGKVYVTETGKCLSRKGADTQKNKYLPPYSVCVSCIATPGLVVLTSKEIQTNQQINSVIPKALSPFYVYGLLDSLGDQIRAGGSGGSVFVNLNKSRFSALKVLLANDDCVKAFHVVVEQLYHYILENQKESSVISNLRDTLLPKLISGELRVPDAEKFVEDTV